MKSTSAPFPLRRGDAAALLELPADCVGPDRITDAPPASGAVRILLGIDVPAAALPEIEADWALVAETQQTAPDLAPGVIAGALARLQRHALHVSGVAVAEALADPFARWVRKTEDRTIAA